MKIASSSAVADGLDVVHYCCLDPKVPKSHFSRLCILNKILILIAFGREMPVSNVYNNCDCRWLQC